MKCGKVIVGYICYLLAFVSIDISFTLAQFAFSHLQFDLENIH